MKRPAICDIVTVRCPKGDHFYRQYDGTLTRWRVSGFLKKLPKPTLKSLLIECRDEFIAHFVWERIKKQTKEGTYRHKMRWCLPEDATHVCLTGVCGAIAEIGKCQIVDRVPWDTKTIQQEEETVRRWAGRLCQS